MKAETASSHRGWFVPGLVIALVAFAAALPAQESEAPSERPLRIGYVAGGEDAGLLESPGLAETLQRDEALGRALDAAGYGRVVLSPAASLTDLRENMAIRRYGVVFAPLAALRSWDPDAYAVVLQRRRPGDAWDPRGQVGTQQRSVLFARAGVARSPAEGTWALLGGESASGYLYPRLHLLREHGVAEPRDLLLRSTPEEVFFAVANGLRDYGALEQATFDSLMAEHERRVARTPLPEGWEPAAIRVLENEVIWVPADPMLLARDLEPRPGGAGAALREAIQRCFAEAGSTTEWVAASDARYAKVREDIEQLYRSLEQGAQRASSGPDGASLEPIPRGVATP